jgi:hypothetical protein
VGSAWIKKKQESLNMKKKLTKKKATQVYLKLAKASYFTGIYYKFADFLVRQKYVTLAEDSTYIYPDDWDDLELEDKLVGKVIDKELAELLADLFVQSSDLLRETGHPDHYVFNLAEKIEKSLRVVDDLETELRELSSWIEDGTFYGRQ